jgi:hypothetical protein
VMENLLRKLYPVGWVLRGGSGWFSFYSRENTSGEMKFWTSLHLVLVPLSRCQDQQFRSPSHIIILYF